MTKIAASILIICFCLMACSSSKILELNGKKYKITAPPGTVQIAENLYADETEINNINYREYIYWMKRVYGEQSSEYLDCLSDKKVWENANIDSSSDYSYFDHPAYNDYPIIGITLKQAQNYTNWRTDRVAENILIQKKAVKRNLDAIKENHFTIERYLSGDFPWIIEKKETMLPKYRIPNELEWEMLAYGKMSNSLGVDSLSRMVKKWIGKGHSLFNMDNLSENRQYESFPMSPCQSYPPNSFGLYNTIGNVSEMISNKASSKGGSWKDLQDECLIDNAMEFDEPNCWTGFRNICTWRLSSEF